MSTLKQIKAAHFKLLSPGQQASKLAWDSTDTAIKKDNPDNHKIANKLHLKAFNVTTGRVADLHKECASRHLEAQFGVRKFVTPTLATSH
jgi:hypothetical protein